MVWEEIVSHTKLTKTRSEVDLKDLNLPRPYRLGFTTHSPWVDTVFDRSAHLRGGSSSPLVARIGPVGLGWNGYPLSRKMSNFSDKFWLDCSRSSPRLTSGLSCLESGGLLEEIGLVG